LAQNRRQPDQDKPCPSGNGAGNNEGITKAERVVRNAESERDESGSGGQEAYDQQNDSHPVSAPLT
jgi:hypothetical protein